MAHSLSAKKRIRQNVKRRARNRWRKQQVKDAVRAFDEAIRGGSMDEAAKQLQVCYKRLDIVASKGVIHKNAAARSKARLARRLDAAKA